MSITSKEIKNLLTEFRPVLMPRMIIQAINEDRNAPYELIRRKIELLSQK